MHRRFRLRSSADFRRVKNQGKAFRNDGLVLLVLENDLGICRFGFIVSKKLGNAVVRNRMRRIMRESARQLIPESANGYDIVMIPTKQAVGARYQQIEQNMWQLMHKAGVLR